MKHTPAPGRAQISRDEDDAAAVLAVLLALRSPAQSPPAEPPGWGRPDDPAIWAPGSDAWWASGLGR